MPKSVSTGKKLFSLAAFSTGAKMPVDLPDRILVVPWGKTETRKGLMVCDATTAAVLPGRQLAEKFDRVALDFDHNTVKPGPEPKKVAGYGTPEVVPGEGIYLSAIEYTEDGRDLLSKGHYPDISPAVIRDAAGTVIFLHSVGACRQGEVDGLTLFSSSPELKLSTFASEAGEENAVVAEESAELRAAVLALLALVAPDKEFPPHTGDADLVEAALEVAKAGSVSPTNTADDAEDAREDQITALHARFGTLERELILDRAALAGKVVPLSADQIDRMDVTTLKSLVDGLPVTVPTQSLMPAVVEGFSANPYQAGVTPELRQVAEQMGLDPQSLVG